MARLLPKPVLKPKSKPTIRAVKPWTDLEDSTFVDIIERSFRDESMTLAKAIDNVAAELQRSRPACENRYHKSIRSKINESILKIIIRNNPALHQRNLFDFEFIENKLVEGYEKQIELSSQLMNVYKELNLLEQEYEVLKMKLDKIETGKIEFKGKIKDLKNQLNSFEE